MPLVKINYDNKLNYPALMLLIVFPPASGKGAVSQLKKLLKEVNKKLIEETNEALQKYNEQFKCYNQAIKKGDLALAPQKPKAPALCIPGNVSSAKLIEQLNDNGAENMAVICETEADVFGVASSSGGFGTMNSAILRQAYHNEEISQSRKTNNETLRAETPKLVVVLAGTENQVKKYSRVMRMVSTLGSCLCMEQAHPSSEV